MPWLKRSSLTKTFVLFAIALLSVGILGVFAPRAKANDLPVISVSGTLQQNQTWQAGSVYMITGTVTVPQGIMLTIADGAIVKYSAISSSGIRVEAGGILNVTGTSSNPVSFTSHRDDSLGGDSNANGPSTAVHGDYNYGVYVSGGTVNIANAIFQYANSGVKAVCGQAAGPIVISDSLIKSKVEFSSCGNGTVQMVRNELNVPNGYAVTASQTEIAGIKLAGLDKNFATSPTAGNVFRVYNNSYVASGSTMSYSGEGNIVLLSGGLNVQGALNLENGAIVKGTQQNHSLTISQSGSLNVAGTSDDPVVFTSYRDDSLGGDSGNDGITSGVVGDYSSAVSSSGGSVAISRAVFRYGWLSIENDSCTATIVHDSTIESTMDINSCPQEALVLERNTFDVANGYAISVMNSELSGIALSGPNANTFNGGGQAKTIEIRDSNVATGLIWDVSDAATLYVSKLTVNGTLNFSQNAVVKYYNVWSTSGIIVSAAGRLNINGGASAPVIFTSIKDDSVAGDSAGDGPTSGQIGDYPRALNASGAINISHGEFRYGSLSIGLSCNNGATLDVIDSRFESRLDMNYCGPGDVSLQRNTFDVESNYAVDAFYSNVTGIVLSGPNKNTFTGSGRGSTLFIRTSEIPADVTWTVDASAGATLLIVRLTVNGTLNLGSGVLVKNTTHWTDRGIVVASGGQLNVTGTVNAPVTITSVKDDSIGGDTGGDGSTVGGKGDYPEAITLEQGSAVNVVNVEINYASSAFENSGGTLNVHNAKINQVYTALYATDGIVHMSDTDIIDSTIGLQAVSSATVTYRGSIVNASSKAIQACNWDQSCSVDAAYVEWGNPDGPNPPSGALACGKVVVSPWKYNGTIQNSDNLFIDNCDSSPTPPEQLESSTNYFQQRMSDRQLDCNNGFQDACDAIQTAMACFTGAINVATSYYPVPIPQFNPNGSMQTWNSDVGVAALDYVEAGNVQDPPSLPTRDLFSRLTSVVGLYGALSSGYNQCAP